MHACITSQFLIIYICLLIFDMRAQYVCSHFVHCGALYDHFWLACSLGCVAVFFVYNKLLHFFLSFRSSCLLLVISYLFILNNG